MYFQFCDNQLVLALTNLGKSLNWCCRNLALKRQMKILGLRNVTITTKGNKNQTLLLTWNKEKCARQEILKDFE